MEKIHRADGKHASYREAVFFQILVFVSLLASQFTLTNGKISNLLWLTRKKIEVACQYSPYLPSGITFLKMMETKEEVSGVCGQDCNTVIGI